MTDKFPGHIKWLKDTKIKLKTLDGKEISVFEFSHQNDIAILAGWAKHLRNHYCDDKEIDLLREGTGCSKSEYLINFKFPDELNAPGPSIRAGDVGEILVADYLQYVLNYWVPRTRYCDKDVRNESTKGSDVIGFKLVVQKRESPLDRLAIYETKTQFSKGNNPKRLQDAVDGSAKDITRKAESLNAIKQRLLKKGQNQNIQLVERFQNQVDHPYSEEYGAVALFSTSCFEPEAISTVTDASCHPNKKDLILIVIHGEEMMKLVNDLYKRASDEA